MNDALHDSVAHSRFWAEFADAQSREQLLASWLALLCIQIGQVTGGLLLLASDQENTFAPAAVWPNATNDLAYLAPIAQQALIGRRGVVIPHVEETAIGRGAYVAYPVEIGGELMGVVLLDTAPRSEHELQHALRQVHWAIAWLLDLFRQDLLTKQEHSAKRIALVNGTIATALQERRFRACVMALVNDLTTRLACTRVSIGLERDGNAWIEAISHTAVFDRKANHTRLVSDAMDEVLDLGVPVCIPAHGDDVLTSAANAALAAEAKGVAVLSVPLAADGRVIGVLVFERRAGPVFDAPTIEVCTTLGLLVGPILDLKRDNERGVMRRAWDASKAGVHALFGPEHGGAKLITTAVLAVVIFLSFATGEYRVAAKTVVEGAIQRAAAAPFDGFIAESFVRAGDIVRKDQVLVQLDDRDLKVERAKWSAEHEQYARKYRQALATADRASMRVLGAQASQAEAQVALVDAKLVRAQLVAPFDGVVVSGDLNQLLGTPVEQGKVLFEIAPLDAYRIILQVDEREIEHLALGQTGHLALSGMPGEHLTFSVKQITPVSTAEEGRNFFRIEANMTGGLERLRPGMEGVSKVSVGERKLIWIATHSLVDWITMSLWKWLP